MEPENYLIRFIPSRKFSDPSYHCAHFYELFSLWANEEDRPFWKKAAKASREYLKLACHPETGLAAEYAYYDGSPYDKEHDIFGRHDWFYSDSYRVIANLGLDHEWFVIFNKFDSSRSMPEGQTNTDNYRSISALPCEAAYSRNVPHILPHTARQPPTPPAHSLQ